ncbi:hypothetical protein ACFXOQ_37310, partial [Streptomyces californicus]
MIWMALRPSGSEVQQVSAVAPLAPSAIELDTLPTLAHDAPPEPGLPRVAADDEEAKLSALKAKTPCGTQWKGTRPHVAQVSNMV